MRKLDEDVLKAVLERNGLTVAEVIKPLLGTYSNNQMRRAVLSLAGEGFLRIDRNSVPRSVFVHITPQGRQAIT